MVLHMPGSTCKVYVIQLAIIYPVVQFFFPAIIPNSQAITHSGQERIIHSLKQTLDKIDKLRGSRASVPSK